MEVRTSDSLQRSLPGSKGKELSAGVSKCGTTAEQSDNLVVCTMVHSQTGADNRVACIIS